MSLSISNIDSWIREAEPGLATVLLIHGLTGNSRWWEVVVEHLSPGSGFVAPDLRGRGASWELPGPWGIRRHTDDLAELIVELDLGPLVVAGYSMGGWVATMLANRHPDLVSAVVAVDGGLRLELPRGLSHEEAIETVVGPAVTALSRPFSSAGEFRRYWEDHPALGPYLDEVRTPSAGYSLTGHEPDLRIRVSREAASQDGTEFLLDEEVITAAQRVTQPMTLIAVDQGLLDQPGGFMTSGAIEEATAGNPHLTVRFLEDTNHYTLMLGRGAPQVAATIEEVVASVTT